MLFTGRRAASSAIVSLALVLAACSSDDASPSAASATSPATTVAAEVTLAAETTVADTTVAVETTDVVDTTEVAVEFIAYTSDELLAALPTVDDLGDGWSDSGGAPTVDPEGAEGPGIGTCSGANGAGRALANGATAIVFGPGQIGPDERVGGTSIYVFPDDVMAQGFIDLTAETIDCPDGVTWERVQKSNPVAPDEFNGFGPGFEDVTENQIWTFTETAASTYADGGTDVLFVMLDRARELTAADITFGQVDTTLVRYDRYDNVVIVTAVTGVWDQQGYIGAEDLINFEPTAEDLDEYTQLAQPVVLERLGWE